jgi:hypothetical protein
MMSLGGKKNMKTTLALTFAVMMTGSSIYAEKQANGLDFRTPDGWTVKAYSEEVMALLPPDLAMEPGGKVASEYYMVANLPGAKNLLDPQAVAAQQAKYVPPAGTHSRAVGAPQSFQAAAGIGYLYRYEMVGPGGTLHVHIYTVAFPAGGGAVITAAARPALLARREATIATLAATLPSPAGAAPTAQNRTLAAQTAAPSSQNGVLAAQWDQRLRGRKLHLFSGYSSSYGSGGTNSQKTLLLGANGMYEFRRSSSTAVYVSGASGGSVSQNGAQGRWRIYEQGGKALLELVSSDGILETIPLTADGSKTLLNGQRWLVGD